MLGLLETGKGYRIDYGITSKAILMFELSRSFLQLHFT